MGGSFATIGEILVDFTPLVDCGTTVGFRMHAGGSPCNVAVGLARCGARVEFAGAASTDLFGRFLVARLEREGVGTRFLARSAAPSTLAFIAVERDGPSFSFYRTGAADTQLRAADVPPGIDESDVLHFGSISLLAAPTSETVLALVDRLRGRRLLSFDPNIRPSLIGDPDAYRRSLGRAVGAADVVKLSEADLAWWMPGTPVEEAADGLRALGPALVVVTLGGRGCYARASRCEMRVPAPRVKVVDTVGAGDAFSSGLLLRLWERGLASRRALEQTDAEVFEDVLRFAAAAAALTCTKAGADPPQRGEIEQLLGRGVGHAAH
ncbi:MAG TPA: carbohydrate kinase [bacterium]|nr:carbohydrate kinase [bacterium]